MDKKDLARYKSLLETEYEKLIAELGERGQTKPENPNDWEATEEAEQEADPIDRADEIEEYGARTATLSTLEARLYNVRKSLSKIADGRYGICIRSEKGKPHLIEKKRLDANPAARTCLRHLNT